MYFIQILMQSIGIEPSRSLNCLNQFILNVDMLVSQIRNGALSLKLWVLCMSTTLENLSWLLILFVREQCVQQ